MIDNIYTFLDGFRNRNMQKGRERATVNLATNTLRMNVPADDEQAMTKAAAHVLPEESLHGDWDVAIVHTLGHLALGADEALEHVVLDPEDGSRSTEHLTTFSACQRTLNAILAPMMPFVEAVDKFQILTVLAEDTAIKTALQDSLAEQHGERAAEAFLEDFDATLEAEMDVVTGDESPVGDDGTYVNPLYFHALSDIATTDWGRAETGLGDEHYNTNGRAIAEAVARATLDVPYPIAPLGGDRFPNFDALSMPGLDLGPIEREDLLDDSRYPITRSTFRKYLGHYREHITADEFRFTFEQARESWVARAFVNVRQALDDIHTNSDVVVTELDTDELRDRLVERVHGVDPTAASTMRGHPTVMFDVPRRTTPVSQDEDIMSQEGPPLPKILMGSFEQHGSFAGVVYNLTESDTKYELNWYVKTDSFDLDGYQHVPESAETFPDVWRHYHVWDGLRRFVTSGYWEHVLDELASVYDSLTDLESAIEAVPDDVEVDDLTSNPLSRQTATADNRGYDASWMDDVTEENRDRMLEAKVRERLSQVPTSVLLELASDYGCGPDQLDVTDLECPLCQISGEYCGGDSCRYLLAREQFVDHLPAILEWSR